MSDSNVPEGLDAKHEQNRQERIQAVKRWIEYIQSEPPEKWGPQQNTVVNAQLEAAQSGPTSAAHQQHVKDVAREIAESRDESDGSPSKRISAVYCMANQVSKHIDRGVWSTRQTYR